MNIKDFHSWCHSHSVVSEKTNGNGGPKKDIVGKHHPGGELGYQGTQTALSAAGQIPVAGEVADLAAAAHSLASGRLGDAAMNAVNAIPVVGNFTGAAKLAKSGIGTAKAAKAAKAAKETKIANKAKETISGKKVTA
jgi:hypothetical protein